LLLNTRAKIAITNAAIETSGMAMTNVTAATSDMIAMARTTHPLCEEEASAIFFVMSLGPVQYQTRSSDAA
jgi:hypothetical protein